MTPCWCVVLVDTSSENLKFYEKTANFILKLQSTCWSAEFSDPSLLNECLKIAMKKKIPKSVLFY